MRKSNNEYFQNLIFIAKLFSLFMKFLKLIVKLLFAKLFFHLKICEVDFEWLYAKLFFGRFLKLTFSYFLPN